MWLIQVEKDSLGLIYVFLRMHLAKFHAGLIRCWWERVPAEIPSPVCHMLASDFTGKTQGQNSNLSPMTHSYQEKSVISLLNPIAADESCYWCCLGRATFLQPRAGQAEVVFRVEFGLWGWHWSPPVYCCCFHQLSLVASALWASGGPSQDLSISLTCEFSGLLVASSQKKLWGEQYHTRTSRRSSFTVRRGSCMLGPRKNHSLPVPAQESSSLIFSAVAV